MTIIGMPATKRTSERIEKISNKRVVFSMRSMDNSLKNGRADQRSGFDAMIPDIIKKNENDLRRDSQKVDGPDIEKAENKMQVDCGNQRPDQEGREDQRTKRVPPAAAAIGGYGQRNRSRPDKG